MRIAVCVAAVLALGAVTADMPHPAFASCAPAPSVDVRLASATVAFVGTVNETSDGDRLARVRVEEIWKGARLPEEVQMDGTVSGTGVVTSADRTYAVGHRYLFLPSNATSPFKDIDCSGTVEYTPTVAALRPATALAPTKSAEAVSDRGWILPALTLGGAGLAATLGACALILRRRRAGAPPV